MLRKKFIILSIVILLFAILNIFSRVYSMTHYEETDFVTGLVTATSLNVRQGPGTSYKISDVVYKDEYIRVFAKIGDWYVVQTDKDIIGTVKAEYIKPIYPNTNDQNLEATPNTNLGSEITEDEQEVLNLINEQRRENGLKDLEIDNELQKVARAKAQDMVENSYFSHTSANYGSPFDMIKSFGITYRTAGENIAGNSTNNGAATAWMNSEGHKANILNNSYNYTGIGVVSSPKYGKIYVQMFMGR